MNHLKFVNILHLACDKYNTLERNMNTIHLVRNVNTIHLACNVNILHLACDINTIYSA